MQKGNLQYVGGLRRRTIVSLLASWHHGTQLLQTVTLLPHLQSHSSLLAILVWVIRQCDMFYFLTKGIVLKFAIFQRALLKANLQYSHIPMGFLFAQTMFARSIKSPIGQIVRTFRFFSDSFRLLSTDYLYYRSVNCVICILFSVLLTVLLNSDTWTFLFAKWNQLLPCDSKNHSRHELFQAIIWRVVSHLSETLVVDDGNLTITVHWSSINPLCSVLLSSYHVGWIG